MDRACPPIWPTSGLATGEERAKQRTWRSIAIDRSGWEFDAGETYRGTADVLARSQLSPVREYALAVLEAHLATARAPRCAPPAVHTAAGDLVADEDVDLGELHTAVAMAAWQGSWTPTLRDQIRLADQAADKNV
ncbi:hypothetical protein [Amycolatopsis sp. NPDC004079]|uniref:hypothetical protein n=1 Tax=Amycolatopsis sp. NPDC004079 TaxID=3154549 RepID=UPI0033A344B6